ncbi:MAG: helix-hairpin-helix domain-containing protein [Mycobacteriales bacterium]
MSAHFDSPSADRLTAIGLAPRAAGWVPDQPPTVASPAPVDSAVELEAEDSATRLDALRLALAARLPDWLALRVEQMSSRALATGLVALVAVVIVITLKLHGHAAPSYGSYNAPSYNGPAASSSSDPAADGSSIVVDVGGKVRRPGLVTLPIGARVADAIRAAGGPLHRRELARIDLAAHVVDGQLLMVGVPASAAGTDAAGSSAPISLSTASLDELETLPGVGPVTAQKIIDWRTSHGGFTSVSQLQQVPGIGPARYSQLSPLVTP